jgi:hypothetical protein
MACIKLRDTILTFFNGILRMDPLNMYLNCSEILIISDKF